MFILNIFLFLLIVGVKEHFESFSPLILLFVEAGLSIQLLLPDFLQPVWFLGLLGKLISLLLLLLILRGAEVVQVVVALCGQWFDGIYAHSCERLLCHLWGHIEVCSSLKTWLLLLFLDFCLDCDCQMSHIFVTLSVKNVVACHAQDMLPLVIMLAAHCVGILAHGKVRSI